MAKKYDDFDEEEGEGLFGQILNIVSRRKREFAIASVAVAVILLGVVVFGSYPDSEETAANESVPIVRADAGDYKTTPDNPGGMEIPYRDSTVFSSVDGAKTDSGTENILADESAEEPLPRDQLFAGLNTEGDQPGGAPVDTTATTNTPAVAPILGNPPQGEVEPTVGAKVEAVEPPSNDALVKEAIGTSDTTTTAAAPPVEALKASPVEAAPAPAVEEVAKVEEPKKVEPAAKAAAKTEPAAGTTAAKVTSGTYFVQLASVKDTAGAPAEYKKMQAKYTGLSGIEFRTQRADLAKGTFYRIQAGPMSKESATSTCNGIKAKGGSCLVVAK